MRPILILAASAILIALGACTANDTAIFHKIDPPGKDLPSTVVDAKQRFLVAVDRINFDGDTERRFCAEPSPDALSAISSSFATSLSVGVFGQGEGAGSLASSLSEAVSQLGTRNATIQLLRDGFYRLCEGYLNDSATGNTYALLATKYVDSMVVLLAIEQLTPSSTEQLRITTGGGSSVTVRSSAGSGSSPTKKPQKNPSQKKPEPANSTGAAPVPVVPTPAITLASLESPVLAPYNLAATEPSPPDAAPPILPVTPESSANPPVDNTDPAPKTPEEESNSSTVTPEENQSDTPDIEVESSGEASADAPSVGTKITQGKGNSPSVEVTNTVAYIVDQYLLRARFNDCLLALDNINFDLRRQEKEENEKAVKTDKPDKGPNDAADALIQSCKEVIKSQTYYNETIEKLLELNSGRAGAAIKPAK